MFYKTMNSSFQPVTMMQTLKNYYCVSDITRFFFIRLRCFSICFFYVNMDTFDRCAPVSCRTAAIRRRHRLRKYVDLHRMHRRGAPLAMPIVQTCSYPYLRLFLPCLTQNKNLEQKVKASMATSLHRVAFIEHFIIIIGLSELHLYSPNWRHYTLSGFTPAFSD